MKWRYTLTAVALATAVAWAIQQPLDVIELASEPSVETASSGHSSAAAAGSNLDANNAWVAHFQALHGEADSIAQQLAIYREYHRLINRMVPSSLLDSALQQAYPNRYSALQALFDGLDRYQQWLLQQHKTLIALTELERNARLWQQRHALFGEQARQIWQQELDQHEQQRLAVQAELQRLHDTEQPLQQIWFDLQSTLSQPLSQTQGVGTAAMANVFFGLDSVQRQLAAMPADQRQAAIDQARQQMGFSQQRRDWLAQRDQQREQRWQRGLSYMQQRQQLQAAYQGAELQQRLAALQQQVFGHEAATIAKEEQQGFYRYQRPRLYGRN
ncbi:hypothetical protein CHH28_07685 [Bacterioplanes sanyensis]|uniref:Lipase modulator n=1 Tax=Bacterioplanes sanyensis TaxID=1249553 RepID=A0A222FIT2_9GAMM|nr:hypothetical protein [Bacterioplanes sanyensis]ASP38562.1 hypothetical protein CHH28_07685 [Bacterioplanes sanyensis]